MSWIRNCSINYIINNYITSCYLLLKNHKGLVKGLSIIDWSEYSFSLPPFVLKFSFPNWTGCYEVIIILLWGKYRLGFWIFQKRLFSLLFCVDYNEQICGGVSFVCVCCMSTLGMCESFECLNPVCIWQTLKYLTHKPEEIIVGTDLPGTPSARLFWTCVEFFYVLRIFSNFLR